MFSFSSALIYIAIIWTNHLNKEKKTATVDLSLMIFAFIGDIILATIIF
jgi:hypothetical protein